MNNKSAVRQSNFEVLRALAMLMIIMHHIIVHAVYDQLNYIDSINLLDNPYFCKPVFYPQLWLIDIGTMFGSVADCIFIIISGYFLAEREKHPISNTSVKLLLQSIFAAVVVCVVNCIYHVAGFSYNDVFLVGRDDLVSQDRFEFFNQSFWYIGFYYMVFVFGVLFLNGFLKKLSKKQYIEFLLILFAFIEFAFSRELLKSISSYIVTFVIGVFLYSLGGYIKKYDPLKRINTFFIVLMLVFTLGCACFATYYCRMLDIEKYLRAASGGDYFQIVFVFNFHNLIVLLNTILLFELFKRIKIKNSKALNYLGAASFMVYLIHDNEFFYAIWYKYDWSRALYSDVWEYVCNIFTVALLTFGIGVVMYSIYRFIYMGIHRLIINEDKTENS